MLYSVIIIAMVIFFAVCEQILFLNVINSKTEEKIELPKLPKKKPKLRTSPEQERIMSILENIDNYNGSGFNQKEIKRVGEK